MGLYAATTIMWRWPSSVCKAAHGLSGGKPAASGAGARRRRGGFFAAQVELFPAWPRSWARNTPQCVATRPKIMSSDPRRSDQPADDADAVSKIGGEVGRRRGSASQDWPGPEPAPRSARLWTSRGRGVPGELAGLVRPAQGARLSEVAVDGFWRHRLGLEAVSQSRPSRPHPLEVQTPRKRSRRRSRDPETQWIPAAGMGAASPSCDRRMWTNCSHSRPAMALPRPSP